jgi:hypothetical protein
VFDEVAVQVQDPVDLVPADWSRSSIAALGHQGEPLIHFGRGDVVVVGEAVARDELGYVEAAALVVEVAPEEHEEVADLSWPAGDEFGGSQFGLDRSDSGQGGRSYLPAP